MRALALALLLAPLACSATRPVTAPPPPALRLPPTELTARERAAHLLNRLAFGPSPRELDEVAALGEGAWIARQLTPAAVDDSAVQAKLAAFPTLSLSTAQLREAYPPLRELARQEGVELNAPDALAQLRETLEPEQLPRQIGVELAAAKLIRAVESRRQLEEVLVDFWFNHFNVSADKGAVRWMITSYERDAIRPHVLGRFRELLGATAHHPAMLFYLDNWASTREGLAPRRRDGKGPRGLNENYARELLELHTLGVEGGYTQEDVREVARAFTGWSIDSPSRGGFRFRPAAHDGGGKRVLGLELPAGGGMDDGERVLDLLAAHPATARFLSKKLCQKFVSDEPPAALVERVAQVFERTQGDLRQVYEALFTSPELWSRAAYGAKTKTPLELAASALRALGGSTSGDVALVRAVARMGEPLYRAQPPTGFPEVAQPWVNAGALVSRLNFGLALAGARVRGSRVELAAALQGVPPTDEKAVLDRLVARVLVGPPSPATLATVQQALAPDPEASELDAPRPVDPALVAGLLLGSPEFQKQ